jgi:hypothetical protein
MELPTRSMGVLVEATLSSLPPSTVNSEEPALEETTRETLKGGSA